MPPVGPYDWVVTVQEATNGPGAVAGHNTRSGTHASLKSSAFAGGSAPQ
jgi:hypothetical protein